MPPDRNDAVRFWSCFTWSIGGNARNSYYHTVLISKLRNHCIVLNLINLLTLIQIIINSFFEVICSNISNVFSSPVKFELKSISKLALGASIAFLLYLLCCAESYVPTLAMHDTVAKLCTICFVHTEIAHMWLYHFVCDA